MVRLQFTIKGEPVAKGRPVITTIGGYARTYTPKKTRDAENNMRAQIVQQLPEGFAPLLTPLHVHIYITRGKPKSARKKDIYPVKKPDLDNHIKSVLDAMNTVVFRDDSQIIRLFAEKSFGVPEVKIDVEEVEA